LGSYLYSFGEHFDWQQGVTTQSGGRDQNRGFIYGGGARGSWRVYRGLSFGVSVEAGGNRFDRERVEFLLIKTRGDLSWTFPAGHTGSVAPYVSFGYRRWIRDLEGTRQLVGLTQVWRTHYGQTGIAADKSLSRTLRLHLDAGLIVPLASRMKTNY